jgi:hypothetical protein
MNRTIFELFRLSGSIGIWKGSKVIGLTGAIALALSAPSRAATIFTENFESGLGSWTSNAGTGTTSAPPSAPPDAPSSTASFVQADGAITRIGRGFSTNPAATSVKLTWYQYTNSTSSTQRYYGQLSSGTAAAPGTGAGGFFRVGANNNASYQALYNNGSTQTLTTTSPLAVGWHLMQLTITPGAANVGSFTYQIDGNAPVTTVSTGVVLMPTNVQLGQTVSNGTAGAPDTSAWFDSIKVEQFAPAATKPTNSTPADSATLVGLDDNLGWTPGTNNSFFDVFFDVTPTLTTPVSSSQAGTSFDPGTLLPNTTYFWRVDAKNVLGDAVTGDVWSFTTVPEPGSLTLIAVTSGVLLATWRRRQ